jgi:hypothetical protein
MSNKKEEGRRKGCQMLFVYGRKREGKKEKNTQSPQPVHACISIMFIPSYVRSFRADQLVLLRTLAIICRHEIPIRPTSQVFF